MICLLQKPLDGTMRPSKMKTGIYLDYVPNIIIGSSIRYFKGLIHLLQKPQAETMGPSKNENMHIHRSRIV